MRSSPCRRMVPAVFSYAAVIDNATTDPIFVARRTRTRAPVLSIGGAYSDLCRPRPRAEHLRQRDGAGQPHDRGSKRPGSGMR